jgi:hypothetical protein
VKPEIARGIRRLVPRRRRDHRRPDASAGTTNGGRSVGNIEPPGDPHYGTAEAAAIGGSDADPARASRAPSSNQGHRSNRWNPDPYEGFDPVEFAEFLDADDSPLPADPAFKERLRQRLWSMVRENADGRWPPTPGSVPGGPRPPLADPDPKPKPER